MRESRAGLIFILWLVTEILCAQSELWDRAAALADLARDSLPGTMKSVMEEVNGDGSPGSTMELVLRYVYDSGGKTQKVEVIRAVRSGKDITEETRKDMEKRGNQANAGPGTFGFNGMLFSPDARKKTRLLPGSSWVERNGRKTALIPFEMKEEGKGSMTGTVEIDAASGIPSLARITGSFPFVSELTFTMEYAAAPSGGFVLSRMEFTGAMSFLGMKKRFHAVMEFSDYRSYAPRG